MLIRKKLLQVYKRIEQFPAVALLGPRQVGKTTLANYIRLEIPSSIYLDLERPSDLNKLSDPEDYFARNSDKLIILDEVQRLPKIFETLRSIIDSNIQKGRTNKQFLLLGSASLELLKQAGESLAGRIAYIELNPLNLMEVGNENLDTLWLRGGFPNSYLANDNEFSIVWRENFIRTYIERDIPQFGLNAPFETISRLWSMVSYLHGSTLNTSQIAKSLGIDNKTTAKYIDFMVDLLLLRKLQPFHRNTKKRLVKTPKLYVRDSGLLHAILNLKNMDDLLSNPIVGTSFEGLIIENLLDISFRKINAYFYRTAGGAEIDLLLELPGQKLFAIEIKRSLNPSPKKGFYHAIEDLKPDKSFVVYPGKESYNLPNGIIVTNLFDLVNRLNLEING